MMLRTVDLDAVSLYYIFASTNERSCHVTSIARPTPAWPPGLHYKEERGNRKRFSSLLE